MLPETSVDTAK